MNILVSINSKFRHLMCVMLKSLCDNNRDLQINVYCLHTTLTEDDKNYILQNAKFDNLNINFIEVSDAIFQHAPTVRRYPFEIYYRLLAAEVLPEQLDRILYLDVDVIVKGNLEDLYNMDFRDNLFLATTNVGKVLTWFNSLRLSLTGKRIYPNTGVVLMNLSKMREVVKIDDIVEFINNHKRAMALYDEDIIFALYGDKIGLIDSRIYNLSDRQIAKYNRHHRKKIDKKWVDEHNIIIHYLGPNKPWKTGYKGILKPYYEKYEFTEE